MDPTNEAQTAAQVIGPEGEPVEVTKFLCLAVEKFRRPKRYRLIWTLDDRAWLAQEDQTPYRRKGEAVVAGQALAERLGAEFDWRVTR